MSSIVVMRRIKTYPDNPDNPDKLLGRA